MTIKTKNINNHYIIYHQPDQTKNTLINDLLENTTPLFEPDYLLDNNKVYKQATGRGQAYFFKHSNQDCVLRHFWRGGLVGKFNKDFYFWNPLKNKQTQLQESRAYQEFSLLDTLRQSELPAPKPVAARISYSWLGYRADIITETLPNTQSLVERLDASTYSQASQHQVNDSLWLNVGKTIAKFHQHNIYHDDLNANNILIDQQGNIYLIDFDKGRVINNEVGNDNWPQRNLDRLLRSFNKEKTKNTHLDFSSDNWQQLLKGYKQYINKGQEKRQTLGRQP